MPQRSVSGAPVCDRFAPFNTMQPLWPTMARIVRQNPFYRDVSWHGLQLERHLEFFPREQILVATAEQLLASRAAALQAICRFLGVDDAVASNRFRLCLHQSAFKRRLTRFISSGRDFSGGGLLEKLSPHVGALHRKIARYLFSVRIERPVSDPATEDFLKDQLADDTARFRKLTGLELPGWNI